MELKIEKLIYGGDGLARLPSTDATRAGKAVFVPFTIAGEKIEAALVEEKPGFARARVQQVLEKSPVRSEPGCPYFGECGGCQYQHIAYEAQVRTKSEILRETLQRTAKIEPPDVTAHPSPPWNYRNRTRMRIRTEGEFAIGYQRFASHVLLPVRECPISSPLINRALAATWKIGGSSRVPKSVREIEFFANAEDSELLLEITVSPENPRRALREIGVFADAMRAQLPELAGIAPFTRDARSERVRRQEVPAELKVNLGSDALLYRVRGAQYQVSAGSFFQTNRYLVDTMVALATDGRSGESGLDLYAGAGLFTLPLSQSFREVAAVEIAPFSFHDLKTNAPGNVTAHRAAVEQYLGGVKSKFDYVILDPPRGGLGEKSSKLLARLRAPRISYVSCDPATLARDLKVLCASGYRIEALHLLDLFPQTFHIETVAHLIF